MKRMKRNMIVKITFKDGSKKAYDDVYYFYSDSNFETVKIFRTNYDEVIIDYDDIEEIKVNEGR